MSVVGPRPERPHFAQQFAGHIPRYTARHRVPAGLTGWAQAHGLRGDTSIEERARFDNYYIENWSPWLDRKSTRLNSSHANISYAVFCLKKKKKKQKLILVL